MADDEKILTIKITGDPKDALRAIEEVRKALDSLKDKVIKVKVLVDQDSIKAIGDLKDGTRAASRAANAHARAAGKAAKAERDRAGAAREAANAARGNAAAHREAADATRQDVDAHRQLTAAKKASVAASTVANQKALGNEVRNSASGTRQLARDTETMSSRSQTGFDNAASSAAGYSRALNRAAGAQRAFSRSAKADDFDDIISRNFPGAGGGGGGGGGGKPPTRTGGGGPGSGAADGMDDLAGATDRAAKSGMHFGRAMMLARGAVLGVAGFGIAGGVVQLGAMAAGIGAVATSIASSNVMMGEARSVGRSFMSGVRESAAEVRDAAPMFNALRGASKNLGREWGELGATVMPTALAGATSMANNAATSIDKLTPAINRATQSGFDLGNALITALGESGPAIDQMSSSLSRNAKDIGTLAHGVVSVGAGVVTAASETAGFLGRTIDTDKAQATGMGKVVGSVLQAAGAPGGAEMVARATADERALGGAGAPVFGTVPAGQKLPNEAWNPDFHPGQPSPKPGQPAFLPQGKGAAPMPTAEGLQSVAPPPKPPPAVGPRGPGTGVGPALDVAQFDQVGAAAQRYGASVAAGQQQAAAATSGTAPMMQGAMMGAQAAVQNAGSTIPPAAQTAFSAIAPAIQAANPVAAVAPVMSNMVAAVSDQSGAMASAGSSIGSSIGQGAAQGTNSSMEIVDTVIVKRVKRVIEQAADALGAHSPSREFIKLFTSTGQGAAIGTERSFGAAIKTSGVMAGRVVSAAESQLSGAGSSAGQSFAGNFAGQLAGGSLSPGALGGALGSYLPSPSAGGGAALLYGEPGGGGYGGGAAPISPEQRAAGVTQRAAGFMTQQGWSKPTAERVAERQTARAEAMAARDARGIQNREAALARAGLGVDKNLPIAEQAAAWQRKEGGLFTKGQGERDLARAAWAEGRNPIAEAAAANKAPAVPGVMAGSGAYDQYLDRKVGAEGRKVGQDAVDGFTAGVKDKGDEPSKSLVQIAGDMINNTKKKLGISSPSRVAAGEIGGPVVAGIGAALGMAGSANRGAARDSGLMLGYVLGTSIADGSSRVIKKDMLTAMARPDLASAASKLLLAQMGLYGAAGSGAQQWKIPAVKVPAAAPIVLNPTLTASGQVVMNGQVMGRWVADIVDEELGSVADEHRVS